MTSRSFYIAIDNLKKFVDENKCTAFICVREYGSWFNKQKEFTVRETVVDHTHESVIACLNYNKVEFANPYTKKVEFRNSSKVLIKNTYYVKSKENRLWD